MLWVWLAPALLVLTLVGLSYYGAGFIIYDPNRRPHDAWPDKFGLAFETVEFRNDAGHRLKGWIVPAKTPKSPRRTILLCHGWGTNKSYILESTRFLAEKGGYDLFYFDTRGNGESEGSAGTIGYLESFDCDAALDYLSRERPAMVERLGVYGQSMGGAVALVATARHPEIRAAVIEASFASYDDVIPRWIAKRTPIPYYPVVPMLRAFVRLRIGADPQTLSPDRFADKLGDKPVFFITGDHDWLMPVSDAEKLYAAVTGPKELWVVKGADHDRCWSVGPEEFERRVLAFYDRTL